MFYVSQQTGLFGGGGGAGRDSTVNRLFSLSGHSVVGSVVSI